MSRTAPAFSVPRIEPLERRVLLAILDVPIGDGAARSVSFVDADGTAASVSVRGAAAVVRFTGEGLAQAPAGRGVAVTGAGVSVASVTATGTSRRTALVFTGSGGDGGITVGQISADGPLKCVTAPQVVLTGALSAGGPVRRLELLSTANADVSLGAGAGNSSVFIRGDAVETNLTSHAPLRRMDVFRWVGTSPRGTIAAPSAGAITAAVFRGQLQAGPVAALDLQGIESSTIHVTGSLGRFRGGNMTDSLVNVGGDIGTVTLTYLVRSRIYAGVAPLPPESPLPRSVADFVNPSSIRRLVLQDTDVSGTAVVSARFVGNIRLRMVIVSGPARGDVTVVADRIGRVFAERFSGIGRPTSPVRLPRLDAEVREIGSAELRAL